MTYCVGLRLDRGLVFMSDTRTNSGVDNISVFRKMYHWSRPGERAITLMAAGNLATTQTVVSVLDERTKVPEDRHSNAIHGARKSSDDRPRCPSDPSRRHGRDWGMAANSHHPNTVIAATPM